MRRITLMILGFAMLMNLGCEKDETNEKPFIGVTYEGQSLPLGVKYIYAEGTYSAWVSFIDQTSYSWGQKDVQGEMPTMTVPCEYDSITGKFSNVMEVSYNDETYGASQDFPVSFCIDDMNKMYLFTFDSQKDTNEIFTGNLIAEKLSGSIGEMEGTYKSSLKANNWFSNIKGKAETKIEAELNYTYEAGTFSGTRIVRNIDESTIDVPEYEIEIGLSDVTDTSEFNGTWVYNEEDNTITETLISPISSTYTYSVYWVNYNDKLYLATSQTRFYQKDGTGK